MAKPRLLFYLKPQGLEVYSDQNQGSANLNFPPQLVRHQEVFDGEQFLASLEKFLTELGVADLPIIILISKPLIYAKQFVYQQTGVDRNLVEDFINTVPFDNAQIAQIELSGRDSLLILATNRLLYQKIVDIAQKLGAKVEAVVPDTVFNLPSPVLSPDDVNQIYDDKKTLESANFLVSQTTTSPAKVVVSKEAEESGEDIEEEEKEGKSTNKLLIIFGGLFILGGLAALGLMSKLIKNPWAKNETPVVKTTSPSSSTPAASVTVSVGSDSAVLVSSSSAAQKEVAKDKLNIQIINGTGVAGQSTRVKDLLTKLGYKNIEIGNIQITGETKTVVDFSSKVSQPNRQEMIKGLQDIFATVSTKDASPSAKYDISVITGIYK